MEPPNRKYHIENNLDIQGLQYYKQDQNSKLIKSYYNLFLKYWQL